MKRLEISLALYETRWYRDYIGSETNLAIYTEIAKTLLQIFYILRIIYIHMLYIHIEFLKIFNSSYHRKEPCVNLHFVE